MQGNIVKTAAVITIVLLMASVTLVATVQAQRGEVVYPPGTVIKNPQPVGGISPLPSGVTPDISYESIAHVGFRPDPVGVGQPLLVNMWLQPPIDVIRYLGKAFVVTITKPDGNKDVFGPLDSYAGDSTAWFDYVPDKVGTWQIKLDYAGTYYPPGNYTGWTSFGIATTYAKYMNWTLSCEQGVWYKPDSDGPYNFTVQNEMALSWPTAPLPTDYWTRPVNALNREWWPILGNYPANGVVSYPGDPYWPADTNTYVQNTPYHFTPYVQGPNTAHIVWKELTALAGVVGGSLGQYGLTAYSGAPTIIYSGMCYGTVAKPGIGPASVTYWQCKDLRTGQLIWERPLATGESAPNEILYITTTGAAVEGATEQKSGMTVRLLYCGGGRVLQYDPWTGSVVWNTSIAPLTTGTHYANSENGPLYYSVQDLGAAAGANRYRLINWTIAFDQSWGTQANVRLGVISNVTWPFSSLGSVDFESNIALNYYDVNANSTGVAMWMYLCAASLIDGRVLWNISTPQNGLGGNLGQRIADDGKYATRLYDDRMHAWDLQTGKEVWVADISNWPWGVWGAYITSSAYGLLIQPQYDAVVAYNWTNGNIEWEYHYPAQYPYDNAFGMEYPFFGNIQIADGKVYMQNNEHSPTQPVERGYSLHCINATTGEGIWNISGSGGMSGGPVAVADGYLVFGDGFDGYLYTFGKGKSASTVTASPKTIAQGAKVLIEGTVMDQSPAQPGTPCVSAASMKTQMEYLHMQQSIKGISGTATIIGVPVTLTALGSDGSVYDLGSVTSNGYYGTFAYAWNPPKEDTYTIIASFAADDSYGSSNAATSVTVGPAPATINIPEVTTPVDNTNLLYGMFTAIIAAIVIGLAALIGVFRKK
jgi:hypothetical protein